MPAVHTPAITDSPAATASPTATDSPNCYHAARHALKAVTA